MGCGLGLWARLGLPLYCCFNIYQCMMRDASPPMWEPPGARSRRVGSGKWKRLERSPQGQIVTVGSRGYEILGALWSAMHQLQICLPVSSRKISIHRRDQQECWSEPLKHQMASEINWIRRSQSKSCAYSPGHEGLLPRAARRQRASPALQAEAADVLPR